MRGSQDPRLPPHVNPPVEYDGNLLTTEFGNHRYTFSITTNAAGEPILVHESTEHARTGKSLSNKPVQEVRVVLEVREGFAEVRC